MKNNKYLDEILEFLQNKYIRHLLGLHEFQQEDSGFLLDYG